MKPDQTALELRGAYEQMALRFGHQDWWPGETPFEVCVGAILTQNTSWRNVEKVIGRLKAAGVLSPVAMFEMPETELAEYLRPAGYFNVKARRLRSFLRVLVEEFHGDLSALMAGRTSAVRERLLKINGIGPETADSMLLYAGGHSSFVVDAYTKRIFTRHQWCRAGADYAELKGVCEGALRQKTAGELLDYWQDYHAQLVCVGKDYCRPRDPRCSECPLQMYLKPGALPEITVPGTARRRRSVVGL